MQKLPQSISSLLFRENISEYIFNILGIGLLENCDLCVFYNFGNCPACFT